MGAWIALAQIALQILMFFMDPKRAKREEIRKKKEGDEDQRSQYAEALQSGRSLTVAYHLDSVLREAQNNRARGRQNTKEAKTQ